MLRFHQNLIKYHIVNPNIVHSPYNYKYDPKLNLYPVVGFRQVKLGAFSLNLPNNQNLLTLEAMDQLFRYFTTYQHDHTVQNIWIENRGGVFSGGADYKQMITNQDYIDKLYKLALLIAKLNKPTFAYLKGGVRGVGAYILSMMTVPISNGSSSLKIDQVERGFIPIGGGSHRLSRLPGNLGLYLSLTGKKLSADQMSRLGLLKGFVKEGVTNKQLRHHISRSNLFFRQPLKFNHFDGIDKEVKQTIVRAKQQAQLQDYIKFNQDQVFLQGDNIFTKLALNQHRVYNIFYQNQLNPDNTFTQKPGRVINNYYQLRHQKAFDALKKHDLVQKSQYKYVRLPNEPLVKIIKIFGHDTLQQTIKELQNDQSQWAQQTLRQIRKKDPLAAQLTFKLLKKAQKLPWDKCLELQYRVAKRLLRQSKLEIKDTYSGSKFIYQNKYSQSKLQDVSSQVLEKYFAEADNQQDKIQLQVPEYTLLPNNDYISTPDSARSYLNKVFFDDVHLKNQQRELKRFFAQQKIDYRAQNFTIDALRQKYYQYLQTIKVTQKEQHRLQIIINNQEELRKLSEQRQNYVKNFPEEQLRQLISENLRQCFSTGINQRFDQFTQTAQINGLEEKLKIFKNIKKIMMKSVVLNGQQAQEKNRETNQKFKGPIYFDKQGKSILKTTNPLVLKNQALKQLNQSIGDSLSVNDEYLNKYENIPAERNLGSSSELFEQQIKKEEMYKRINKRYIDNPREWDNSFEYIQLVRRASNTSEQLAGMLQWTNEDYYNTMLSYPTRPQTYIQKAEKISVQIKQQRQELKENLSQLKQLNQIIINNILEQNNQNFANSQYNIFPKYVIPEEFKHFKSVLKEVLQHFQEKYNGQKTAKREDKLNAFDDWLDNSTTSTFVQYYKWDIQYVFSYISILKLKDILSSLKANGLKNMQQLQLYLNSLKLDFKTNDKNQINKTISRFLYNMLDMHTISKAKIRLPQTKLLDFFNRLKIRKQTELKSSYPLSFQSLMLLIAKDRSKIYNKILQQYLPTQPQFLLQTVNKQAKPSSQDELSDDNVSSSFYMSQNSTELPKKGLLAGYQYYIGLFDGIIQKASGKYSFLNQVLRNSNPQIIRQQLKDILNLSISNQQWFKQALKKSIKNFFQMRKQFQKYLTKGQLLALDQQTRQALQPSIVKSVLQYKVNVEIQGTKRMFSKVRSYTQQSDRSQKNQQMYCWMRSSVKNPAAFKRLNNFKLIERIQKMYFLQSKTKQTTRTRQEVQDLEQEGNQFQSYERFPDSTRKRWMDQIFQYPTEQKNFNAASPKQIKQIRQKLTFNDRYGHFKQQVKYTEFGQQIKELKNILQQQRSVEDIYKKIQTL